MPDIETKPVGADTIVRGWRVDIQTGTDALPAWTRVFGITEFKPTQTATTQDTSDFDGEGWGSDTNTMIKWGAEFKVRRGAGNETPTEYDPGQEILQLAAEDLGSELKIRMFKVNGVDGPVGESFEGMVCVTWEPDGGPTDTVEFASVKLMGRGKRSRVVNPSVAA